MTERCKANPCCGEHYGKCEVPLPQHRSGLWFHNTAEYRDNYAVDQFAEAMKAKLAKKRAEGRGGWDRKDECSKEFLSQLLRDHIGKGDPVDVANFCMMLQQRGERISSPGKDGGQEVEAVAVLGYVREAGLRSLAERNHTSVYPSPDEERGYTIPVYAQPASTALVERLTKALEPFAAAADRYDSLVLGEDIDHWPCKDGDVTLGDLRKASAVLKAKSPSNVGAPQGDDFMHRLIENAFSWAVEDTNYLDPKATGRLIEATRSGMKPEEAREWRSDLPEIIARKAALSASTSREGESR